MAKIETQVQAGEVVGVIECASCGGSVDVKVNRKGGLCAICTNVIDPEAQGNKKYCWHRTTYSRHAVSKIIQKYLEGKAETDARDNDEKQSEPTRGSADGGEPELSSERSPEGSLREGTEGNGGGIFGKLFSGDGATAFD
ncbi:MAG: hypothetical protein ACRBDL_03445 [Alphaproteobacteria bacterium]